MQHSEKNKPRKKKFCPFDLGKDLHLIAVGIKIGSRGKWQKAEIMFYGNPFYPPVGIVRPKFRALKPL